MARANHRKPRLNYPVIANDASIAQCQLKEVRLLVQAPY